jgi:hypothetical protein
VCTLPAAAQSWIIIAITGTMRPSVTIQQKRAAPRGISHRQDHEVGVFAWLWPVWHLLRDLAVVDARETELVPSAADGDAIGVFRARLGAVLPGQAQMSVVPGSMPGPTGGRPAKLDISHEPVLH